MPPVLDRASVLSAWEAAAAQPAPMRGLALLDALGLAAGDWPVGRVASALMDLREALLGGALECLADCPACGEPLEFACSVADLRGARDAGDAPMRITLDDCDVVVRVPPLQAVAEASKVGSDDEAQRALLATCVVSASRGGAALPAHEFSAQLVAAIDDALALADPQAATEIALACPACAHAWTAPFDAAGFVFAELSAWAARQLDDVALLARAYGWGEADILAMSPVRRQAYRERLGQ